MYLAGAVVRELDYGVAWRQRLTRYLADHDVEAIWPPDVEDVAHRWVTQDQARAEWQARPAEGALACLRALARADACVVATDTPHGSGTAAEVAVARWIGIPVVTARVRDPARIVIHATCDTGHALLVALGITRPSQAED